MRKLSQFKSKGKVLGLSAGLLSALFLESPSHGMQYSGRMTLGGFASSENHAKLLDGQSKNDFAMMSSRVFFRVKDIGSEHLEVTLDARDKFDFFEKLDPLLVQLGPENSFQFRRLSVGYPNERGSLFGEVGRFPIVQAGDVHVDGFQVGWHRMEEVRLAAFGGLNPKAAETDYFGFDSSSSVFGFYSAYQPKSENWNRYTYVSGSVAGQMAKGHMDRLFLTQNTVYQWDYPNQLLFLGVLDFVPSLYLQSGILSWHQQWFAPLETEASLNALDVLQYTRRQGILETQSPSPYRELELQGDYKINKAAGMRLRASYGVRSVDSFARSEMAFGPTFKYFLDQRISGRLLMGVRNNFGTQDQFSKASLGYSSRNWEIDLDGEMGIRKDSSENTYHPTLLELGVTRQFNREIFGTAFVQKAGTELVDIWSVSVKVGLRVGSQPLPPLRDGSAPRGRL